MRTSQPEDGFHLWRTLSGLRARDFCFAWFVLGLAGCSTTVPFVQINIGRVNDISNALLGGNKGARIASETKTEIGDGSIQVPGVPELPELDSEEENILGAFERFNRAFGTKVKDKGIDDE